MATLQIENVPDELHERLRRFASERHCSMDAAVLTAIERELERWEWRERRGDGPAFDLGIPASELVQAARAERERELGLE